MNESFRTRVIAPLLMPAAIIGVMLLYAVALSRILIAVDINVSVIVAVVVSAYILVIAFVIERHERITGSALAIALVVGLAGLVGAGAVAGSVGARELHEEEEHAAAGEDGEGASAEIPPDALVWEADSSLMYVSAPTSGPAGSVTIALRNEGGLEHNVTIEGVNNDEAIVTATDGVDSATIEIEAGTYTYYCSVAGHRAAGMEGEISFS